MEGGARLSASLVTCVALHAHTQVSTEAVLHKLHTLDDKKPACCLSVLQRMEEVVVMYYATELLHITATLHSAHIIHTDIKPDNLLLREAASSALPAWHPSRPGMWSKIGLCLIDYGRAVDTALLPSNTKFKVC